MKRLTKPEAIFLDFILSEIERIWDSQPIDTWRENILKIANEADVEFTKDMNDEKFSEAIQWGMFCFTLQDLGMYDLLVKIWPEGLKETIPPKYQLSNIITFGPKDGKVTFIPKDKYIKMKLEGKDIIQFERLVPSGVPK